jgi:hypothetical protein
MASNPHDPVQDLDLVSEPDEPPPADPDEPSPAEPDEPSPAYAADPDDPPPTDSDINPTETSEPMERTTLEPDPAVPELLNSLTLQEPSSEAIIHQRHVGNGSLPADFYASAIDEIEIVEEEEEALGSSGGGDTTWANRGDGPPSPSSSGYAAERGSNSASSGGTEEETERDEDWGREKKHLHEVWVFHYFLRLAFCTALLLIFIEVF